MPPPLPPVRPPRHSPITQTWLVAQSANVVHLVTGGGHADNSAAARMVQLERCFIGAPTPWYCALPLWNGGGPYSHPLAEVETGRCFGATVTIHGSRARSYECRHPGAA